MTANTKRQSGQRIGLIGYLRLLDRVKREPLTLVDVQEMLGVDKYRGGVLIRSLRAVGLLHIGGWADPLKTFGTMRAIYHFGPGPDMDYPKAIKRKKAPLHRSINATAIMVKSLLEALETASSKRDVAFATGINGRYINDLMNKMHAERIVHVRAWEPRGINSGGPPIALYVLGDGPDKARPQAPTKSNHTKRERIRRERKRGRLRMLEIIHMTASAANADQMLEAA